jgi:dolichol kinase
MEGVIWFILALCCLYKDRKDFVFLITVFHLSWQLCRHRQEVVRSDLNEQELWRHIDRTSTSAGYMYEGDSMGVYMSIVLVPILFRSIADGLHQHHKQQLQLIALVVSLIQIPFWQHVCVPMRTPLRQYFLGLLVCVGGMAVLAFFMASANSFDPKNQPYVAAFLFTWIWLTFLTSLGPGQFKALRGVMSIGEWFVISSLVAFVFSQWVLVMLYMNSAFDTASSYIRKPFNDVFYAYVAASGVFGCAFACITIGFVQSIWLAMFPSLRLTAIISVMFHVLYLISTTFGIVELCFWYHPGFEEYQNPKFLWWIFGDFLRSVENSPWKHTFATLLDHSTWLLPFGTNEMHQVMELPRLAWVIYWFLTMTITIPIAPSTGRISPVIARKWFHFVTVILFIPATIFTPQLQSLSYAIAITLLLIIESIRHDISWLNHFYVTYLDSNKDETDDATIISHIALVAGCAAPLWLVQYYSFYCARDIALADESTMFLLLGLWGVWVLGIGDALGAIIGQRYGRMRWGYNHRTVEGSAAMFFSLCVTCITATALFESNSLWTGHIRIWLPAVVFVTFLEAYTMQIDNIVLPLAGATVMFSMLQGFKS